MHLFPKAYCDCQCKKSLHWACPPWTRCAVKQRFLSQVVNRLLADDSSIFHTFSNSWFGVERHQKSSEAEVNEMVKWCEMITLNAQGPRHARHVTDSWWFALTEEVWCVGKPSWLCFVRFRSEWSREGDGGWWLADYCSWFEAVRLNNA